MFDPSHLLYVTQTSYNVATQAPAHAATFHSAFEGKDASAWGTLFAALVIGLMLLKAVFRIVWGALQAFFMLLFLGIIGGLGYFSFEGFKAVSGLLAYLSHLF